MSISAVPPRPTASDQAAQWRLIAAALALCGLIAAVIVLAASSAGEGPASPGAPPASAHSGYFRDPGVHAMPLAARATPSDHASEAVPHPRP